MIVFMIAIILYPLWVYLAYKEIQYRYNNFYEHLRPDGSEFALMICPILNMVMGFFYLYYKFSTINIDIDYIKFFKIKR